MSLIHIPLDLYPCFLQPILKVLIPPSQDPTQAATEQPTNLAINSGYKHGFLNISITPIECSIVCNSDWAKSVFEPAIRRLPKSQAKTVAISEDTYAALSVITAGIDAGSRVADLTSPLALANIPIFFITTYYSDFILVPTKDREVVVKTLLARGFVFSEDDQLRLVSPSMSGSPTGYGYHDRHGSGADWGQGWAMSQNNDPFIDSSAAPSSPPLSSPPSPALPSSLDELQERTFAMLKKRSVVPRAAPGLTLVHCTGIRDAGLLPEHRPPPPPSSSSSFGGGTACWVDTVDTRLYTGAVAALAAQPRFLSITLAHDDPPSLLLDRDLLGLFGGALAGPTERALVPVFLDLADLPFEATGIVSGVAGRLVRDMDPAESAELSYLSTARAGAVILAAEHAGKALDVLTPLLRGKEG